MTNQKFADRMKFIKPATSQELIAKVKAMRTDGIEVFDFSDQGASPEVARRAAVKKINEPSGSTYSDTRGLHELRQEIAKKNFSDQGIELDPDMEIQVTVGAKEAILSSLLALVGNEDEVLVEDPGYLGFEPIIRLTGAKPVSLPLIKNEDFRFPLEYLRDYITPRTRVLLLCNPHNPTGRCLTQTELTEIGKIAREKGLIVLIDEAYEHFVYDGLKHLSLAALPEMKSVTITVQTMSKIFNMGGWRIGWATGPAHIMEKIHLVHTHAVTAPTTFAQSGAAAALASGVAEGNQNIKSIITRYQFQRDVMIRELCSIPGISCHVPQGTFFIFPNVSRYKISTDSISNYLLESCNVATVPGSAFGSNGSGYIRMVFKCDPSMISLGLSRMAAALKRLDYA